MIAELPIEGAVLGRTDPAGGDLFNVDMGKAVFDVFFDGEGNGGEGEGAAEEPAYALLAGMSSGF